ncbi:MAG: UDP-N-acetylmuramoyl-L-alanine--D-glutamate ligase [Bryobacteraceae bacterium]|nr:UDP-N-acetylmuramoyl-L-alanine--D-glutamate ligase [Bryobacteraceae bacterium]
MDYRGKTVLVVGMGKSGVAALELLTSVGARVLATDSRPLADLGEAAAVIARLNLGFVPQNAVAFQGVDLIVVSPGVPLDLEELEQARAEGIAVTGELELAAEFLRGPNIGITGANGKTTTTALVGHILRECGIACQVGGNIGWPPAAMVGSSRADQWNVLELSSFQLETIAAFRAEIGVCLNVTPDHLDRHKTFEAYAAAKRRLFETQRPGDWAVLNADDATTRGFTRAIASTPVWFSQRRRVDGMWVDGGDILWNGQLLMPVSEIPLRGRHNVENVMAAAAAAKLAGAPLDGIRAAVGGFAGVEHRLEFVRELRGVKYFNDSKATNVDAALKAIDAFDGGLWIILGGKDKGSDYAPLAGSLKGKARAALLIGAAADKIAAQIGGSVPLIECGTLDAAVRRASEGALRGDTVLLAPACASFDQFRNYEERGRLFKTLVNGIV